MLKRLLVALVVLVFCSAWAVAGGINAGGGLYVGNTVLGGGDTTMAAGGTGVYVSATGGLSDLPLYFAISYSGFGSKQMTVDEEGYQSITINRESSNSLFKAMAGYRLPTMPVAIGVGFISQRIVAEIAFEGISLTENIAASGLALGAMAEFPVADKVTASGQVYYVPSATIVDQIDDFKLSDLAANCLGFEASVAYRATDRISVEGGYRLSNFTITEDYVDGYFKSGGFFLGGKVSF